MLTRESYGTWFFRAGSRSVCALGMVLCIAEAASAQFYGATGGVGRYFDPGRIRGPRGLGSIGGFQKVGSNTALINANRFTQKPLSPMPIGNPLLQSGSASRYRRGLSSELEGDVSSMKYAASISGYELFRTPERSTRVFSSLVSELGRRPGEAWHDRGLSIVGQDFVGGDMSFMPTSAMTRVNQPRDRFVRNTNWTGQTSFLGTGASSLRGALGPSIPSAPSSSFRSRFRPLNQAVYRGAEIAVRADREEPADDVLFPSRTVSLDEIIKTRLKRRMDSYIERGWRQFQNHLYADAYNSFTLADTIEPNAVDAKMGLVFSAIATSQYIAAANALLSMAQHNPDMLERAVDMRAKYGTQADFTRHYQAFEDYMRASPNRNLGALYAYVLWGRGDRTGAQINADKAAEGAPASSSLARLASLMREASAGPRG